MINNSGVYILQLSDDRIKIGSSDDIPRRIRQYKGYQYNGQIPPCLLQIITIGYETLEKDLHNFASNYGLERLGKLEIFKCNDQREFIQKVNEFITTNYQNVTHDLNPNNEEFKEEEKSIVDSSSDQDKIFIGKGQNQSNQDNKNDLKVLKFGKYKGRTYKQIFANHKKYVRWIIKQKKMFDRIKNFSKYIQRKKIIKKE